MINPQEHSPTLSQVSQLELAPATLADCEEIAAIYTYHVLHGRGTFEEIPPSVAEMSARFSKITTAGYPFVVVKDAGKVVAYAYVGPFRERSAYRFTVEDSIYLAPEYTGRKLGRRLLEYLLAECRSRGYQQVLAVIGDSKNLASINLHRQAGFQLVGIMPQVGYKFAEWVDVVIMQLSLN